MKSFRYTRILLLIVAVLGVAYGLSPVYLRMAILYRQPDLNDYTLFNNRVVMAGGYQPWSVNPGYDKRELPEAYRKQFDELRTRAFLVIRDEKIVFAKYWKKYTEETRSAAFTMGNSIVSLLIGAALHDGSIKSVDQPVADFLPDYRAGAKAKITIRNLLEMSSGLNWEESYNSLTSVNTQAYYGDNLSSLVMNLEPVREPGKFYEFQSANVQLLAFVLESATGSKVSTYASEKLWLPVGARTDAYWSTDRTDGMEKAFCGFYAGAGDYARLGQLVLNQGKWNDRQLISDTYLKQALSPDSQLFDSRNKKADYYGWLWWLTTYQDHPVYYMMGLNGQYVMVIPELKVVIVRLGEKCSTEYIRGIPADFFTWIGTGLQLSGS